MSDLDYADLVESFLAREASSGGPPVVTATIREPGTEEGQTGHDVELWGPGCIVYRPAPPTGEGRCQVLVARIGGQPVAIGTRDSRAPAAVGELGPGDAAFCAPSSKAALLCKADGSIALLQQHPEGDAMIAIEKDGALLGRNQWGQVQLDGDGFAVILATGECLKLGPKGFTVTGAACSLSTQTVALGIGAAVPLSFAPVSGVQKPAPNIFV